MEAGTVPARADELDAAIKQAIKAGVSWDLISAGETEVPKLRELQKEQGGAEGASCKDWCDLCSPPAPFRAHPPRRRRSPSSYLFLQVRAPVRA